ncbi:hypothetical protein BGW41_003499 [Actinomortierella wolfii]|nr:hypothetical protein BGW41_003499 [Actinomortierella wolfii]
MDHRPTRVDPRLSRSIPAVDYNQFAAQQEPATNPSEDHHTATYQLPPQIPRQRLRRPSSTLGEYPAVSEHDERSSRPQSFYVPPPSSSQSFHHTPLINRIPSQDSDPASPISNGVVGSGDPVKPIRSRSSSASSTHELSPSQQADADRSRNSHISSQPAHRSKLSKQYTPSDSEESSEEEDQDDDDDDKSEDDSDDEPVMITQARRSRFMSGQSIALGKPTESHHHATPRIEEEHVSHQPHQHEHLSQAQVHQQPQPQSTGDVAYENSRPGTPSSNKSLKPRLSIAKRISRIFGGRKQTPSSTSSSVSTDSSKTNPSSLKSASVSTLSLSSTTQTTSAGNTQPSQPANLGNDAVKKVTNRMSVMSIEASTAQAHQAHRMSMLPSHQRAMTSPETSTPTLLQQLQQRQQQSTQSPAQFHAGYQISPKLMPVSGVNKARDSGFAEPEEAVQHRRYRSASNDPIGAAPAHHRLSMAVPATMNGTGNQRNSVIMLDEASRWQPHAQQQRSNSMPFVESELKRMSIFGGQEIAPQAADASAERQGNTPTSGPKPLISRLERPNHSVCFQEISNKPREVSNQAADPTISQLAQQHRKDFKRMHHQQQQMQHLQQLQPPQESFEVLQPSPLTGSQVDLSTLAESMRPAGHRRESTSSQYYYVPQYHQAGTPARRSSGDSLIQVSMGGVPIPTHTLVQSAAGQPAMVMPIVPNKNPHRASISSVNQQTNGMMLTTLPTPLPTPVPMRPGVATPGSISATGTPTAPATPSYFGLPAPGAPMQISPFPSPSLGAVPTNSATDMSLANDIVQHQVHQLRLQQHQLLLQQQQQQLQQQLHETTQALALSRAAAQSAMAANVTNPTTADGNDATSADNKPVLQQPQTAATAATMYYPAPLLTPMLNMGVTANGMNVLPAGGALYATGPSAIPPSMLATPQMAALVGYQAM